MTLKLVKLSGRMDVMISQMFNQSAEYQMANDEQEPDIICFQGGGDVDPKFYGEKPLKAANCYFDKAHDEWDIDMWNKYPATPKVGICRGGQFLNVMSDGEMWQHVSNHGGGHEVTNLLEIPGTRFHPGTLLEVTSTHHQMMIPGKDGETLCIANKAGLFLSPTDREVPKYDTEVVWYEHTKCLCFQPHPEYNEKYETRAYFLALMKYFFG